MTDAERIQFWEQICNRTTNYDIWKDGKALEYFIIKSFEIEGASVTYPFNVKINGKIVEQIDGAVYIGDAYKILCECKDYDENKINIEPIAKLRYQLCRRPIGTIGCVFSMTDYTEPSTILINYINGHTILLWGKQDIDYAVKNKAFIEVFKTKYHFAIEHANYEGSINVIKEI